MMSAGSSSNSISATSGAPLPAFSALLSGVYSARPAPGFSWVTQIEGGVLLNWLTARLIPGTQAQKVIFVALELPDADSSVMAAALARPAVTWADLNLDAIRK